mgnify:FL=1
MSKQVKSTFTMALIENIYYSVNFVNNYNVWIEKFRSKFTAIQQNAYEEDSCIFDNVHVIPGIQRYPFGYSVEGKYRIYFSNKIGSNYPIYVIISAQELHLNNVWVVLEKIDNTIKSIIKYYDNEINFDEVDFNYKLSRVDICNHNTFINIDKYFNLNRLFERTVTKLSDAHPWIEAVGETSQRTSYVRFGKGDMVVRFYNKIQEVCEQKYKDFFIPRWYDFGLIDEHTYQVYDFTYKLGNNYNVDFLFANIYFSNNDEIINKAIQIYKNPDIQSREKYDFLHQIIRENKIKIVKEVVNVEFQVRSNYLRSLKIEDDYGNIIDYNNIFEILCYIDKLYIYLTEKSFRIIKRNSKCKRKRDEKEMDHLWKKIHNSKIINIGDINIDPETLKLYREYTKNNNKLFTTKRIVNSLTHLYYINNSYSQEELNEITMVEIFNDFYNEYNLNENYFHLKEKLYKQAKRYGWKC